MGPLDTRRHRISQVALGSFLAITLVLLLAWQLSGWRLLSVQSRSMAPALQPGDAVIVRPAPISSLRVGDIVSFHELSHPKLIVTHRVISTDGRRHLVTTKGDDSPLPDLPVNQSLLVGRTDWSVPRLGKALDFFRSPAGLVIGTYVPACTAAILEVQNLTTSYVRRNYRLHVGR